MEGKTFTLSTLLDAVTASTKKVKGTQLDSLGLRLEYNCHLVLEAYKHRNVGPKVRATLEELSADLRDAAKIADALHQPDLRGTCLSLATRIETMAAQYETATDDYVHLVSRLTQAFTLARQKVVKA